MYRCCVLLCLNSPNAQVNILHVSLLRALMLEGQLTVGTGDEDVLVLGPAVLVQPAQVRGQVVTAVAAVAQLLVDRLHVTLENIRPLGLLRGEVVSIMSTVLS